MIEIKKGNIVKEDAEALVNSVNTVGIMGRGIAMQFKKAFPKNFEAYRRAFEEQRLEIGKMLIFSTGTLINPKYIINFPTKKHWRNKSKIEYIEAGLPNLIYEVKKLGIRSVAVPPLGCGLGGLRWADVSKLLEKKINDLPEIKWVIFEPKGAPDAKHMPDASKKPAMTAGRAAVIGLIKRYLGSGLDYPVSLLEIQKLVYFLTAAGEHLSNVKFAKSHYGPYADVLRHVLERVDGQYITGYGDGQNKPTTPINLLPNAAENAESFLKSHPDTIKNIKRVSDLVDGFESPYGMELLATTHWVVMEENPSIKNDVGLAIKEIMKWSPRKAKFIKPEHIKIAWSTLRKKGWFERKSQV
jgi:O-acetyl-ADP-ribose deacetylase (regulator of RNase III)